MRGLRKSLTMSEDDGASPSTRAAGRQRPHERCCCQVCLALICRTRGAHLAFAFASCVRKSAASSGHLPPISAAKTTSLVRLWRCHSSGNVRSLRRLASKRAAPSTFVHLLCGCPSPASGDTSVVSGVSCAHLKRGRPSLTTSSLRPSACTLSKARSWKNTFVETVAPGALPAHSGCHTLHPCHRTRSAVVVTGVTATPANAGGQRTERAKRDAKRGPKFLRRESRLVRHLLRGGRHSGEKTTERLGNSLGHTAPRRKHSSALEDGRCHPCAASAGSRSSRPCRPGRRPWVTVPHPGTSNPV